MKRDERDEKESAKGKTPTHATRHTHTHTHKWHKNAEPCRYFPPPRTNLRAPGWSSPAMIQCWVGRSWPSNAKAKHATGLRPERRWILVAQEATHTHTPPTPQRNDNDEEAKQRRNAKGETMALMCACFHARCVAGSVAMP